MSHTVNDPFDNDPSATSARADTSQARPGTATRDVRFYSADQVAEMLGVTRADVLALVKRGELAAKRIGANVFITADQLAMLMSRHDPRAALPRHMPGDIVVVMDRAGQLGFGRYVADCEDGRVLVRRAGFWGEYQEALAPEQVQPVTCRLPRTAIH
jgi:excisionase family DNA binding protein